MTLTRFVNATSLVGGAASGGTGSAHDVALLVRRLLDRIPMRPHPRDRLIRDTAAFAATTIGCRPYLRPRRRRASPNLEGVLDIGAKRQTKADVYRHSPVRILPPQQVSFAGRPPCDSRVSGGKA